VLYTPLQLLSTPSPSTCHRHSLFPKERNIVSLIEILSIWLCFSVLYLELLFLALSMTPPMLQKMIHKTPP
jgi:hypothetical protein